MKIIDNDTGIILTEDCDESMLNETLEIFKELGYDAVIENAAAGSVSAANVAVNMGGKSEKPQFSTIKRFMKNFNSRVQNRYNPKNLIITVTESFDINSVFSRLASMEKSGETKKSQGTTFGVEDDNGNLMKVTVSSDQATEFEQEIARYIADIKSNVSDLPLPKKAKELSMAELLFKMKDKFDIIDVDFPKIPSDVIYNADQASYNVDTNTDNNFTPAEDDLSAMGDGEFDDVNNDNPLDLSDYKDESGNEQDTGELPLEDGNEDEDLSNEFPEETPSDEGSILTKVIDMLKSQAEADIEKSKADAEKARAEQARYTAQATQFALKDEEERLRYEIEMDNQKKKEKEAKQMADMAKFKISKTLSGVNEADEGITPEMVMRQKQQIALRYKILPTDSPEDIAYKNMQKSEATREFNSRYRQALNAKRYNMIKNEKMKKMQSSQQQQPQGNIQQDNSMNRDNTNEI